jgi:DNA-binding transcriptional MocR family regulator
VRVDPRIDVEAWLAAAVARGLSFHTGKRYTLDGSAAPFLRIGFANYNEVELKERIARLAEALPSVMPQKHGE